MAMILDFHVCPSGDLFKIKNRLLSVGIVKAVLQPVDALPLFYLLPNNFNLFDDLIKINKSMAMTWGKFTTWLASMWDPRMFDNVKLWLDAYNVDSSFFIPMASINPALGERYVREKLEEINTFSIYGLVISPPLQLFNPQKTKAFEIILEYAESKDILIVIHFGPSPYYIYYIAPDFLSNILERYNVKLVLSALGMYEIVAYKWLNNILKFAKKYDEIYVETSSIACILFNTLVGRRLIKLIGTERIIYGSGYPYVKLRRIIRELECIKNAELQKLDKENILYNNAIYLLKI